MKISVLVPAHDEEKSIKKCIQSCLEQTRPADEILVINDGSKDKTDEILTLFGKAITVIHINRATGSKSFAQEKAFNFIKGDVFVCTDADSILDSRFLERIEEDFQDPEVAAVCGYVKNIKTNWLSSCRAIDYFIGQNIHKIAQNYLNFMLVIPGVSGAFRTAVFRKNISFDHDTLAEDLDFTYKLNDAGLKIKFDQQAVAFTQDPSNLKSYINQMRRWYGGGWQNLMKHFWMIKRPNAALELSLMYIEGFVFSIMAFLIPIINFHFAIYFFTYYFSVTILFITFASFKEKRSDFFLALLPYLFLVYLNAFIFLEQFVKEVILKKKNMVWFQPDRV